MFVSEKRAKLDVSRLVPRFAAFSQLQITGNHQATRPLCIIRVSPDANVINDHKVLANSSRTLDSL